MLKEKTGSFSLVLERPVTPFPIQEINFGNDIHSLFNRGRVPIATWTKTAVTSNLQTSCEGNGNTGFIIFSSKYLGPRGWNLLSDQNWYFRNPQMQRNSIVKPISQLFVYSQRKKLEMFNGVMGIFL